jgi:hypothetical protein
VDSSSLGTKVAASAFSELRMCRASFLALFLFLLRRPMLRIVEWKDSCECIKLVVMFRSGESDPKADVML